MGKQDLEKLLTVRQEVLARVKDLIILVFEKMNPVPLMVDLSRHVEEFGVVTLLKPTDSRTLMPKGLNLTKPGIEFS